MNHALLDSRFRVMAPMAMSKTGPLALAEAPSIESWFLRALDSAWWTVPTYWMLSAPVLIL